MFELLQLLDLDDFAVLAEDLDFGGEEGLQEGPGGGIIGICQIHQDQHLALLPFVHAVQLQPFEFAEPVGGGLSRLSLNTVLDDIEGIVVGAGVHQVDLEGQLFCEGGGTSAITHGVTAR